MSNEALTRALAYASCLFTVSLFATTLAVAAAGFAKFLHPGNCGPAACTTIAVKPLPAPLGSADGKAHVDAVAAKLWSRKI